MTIRVIDASPRMGASKRGFRITVEYLRYGESGTEIDWLDEFLEEHCEGVEFGECDGGLEEFDGKHKTLTDINGVGAVKAAKLRKAGYESVGDIRRASQGELSHIDGFGQALAYKVKADVGRSVKFCADGKTEGSA